MKQEECEAPIPGLPCLKGLVRMAERGVALSMNSTRTCIKCLASQQRQLPYLTARFKGSPTIATILSTVSVIYSLTCQYSSDCFALLLRLLFTASAEGLGESGTAMIIITTRLFQRTPAYHTVYETRSFIISSILDRYSFL